MSMESVVAGLLTLGLLLAPGLACAAEETDRKDTPQAEQKANGEKQPSAEKSGEKKGGEKGEAEPDCK